MARYMGPVCRLCRREEHEALPEGRALLHRQVLVRAPPVPAGQARPAPHASSRSTACAAREAEGDAASTACSSASSAATSTKADRAEGRHRRNLLSLLERRLDNVVYRMGFGRRAPRRASSSRHGHSRQRPAGEHPVATPAPGDRSQIHERAARSRSPASRRARRRLAPRRAAVARARQATNLTGTVKQLPAREERQRLPIHEQLDRRVSTRSKRLRLRPQFDEYAVRFLVHLGRSNFTRVRDGRANRPPRDEDETMSIDHDHPQLEGPDPAEGHHRDRRALDDLRQVHLRAARARLRHHARQRAAPRAAVVAAGRRDHALASTARCTSSRRCRTSPKTSPTSS